MCTPFMTHRPHFPNRTRSHVRAVVLPTMSKMDEAGVIGDKPCYADAEALAVCRWVGIVFEFENMKIRICTNKSLMKTLSCGSLAM